MRTRIQRSASWGNTTPTQPQFQSRPFEEGEERAEEQENPWKSDSFDAVSNSKGFNLTNISTFPTPAVAQAKLAPVQLKEEGERKASSPVQAPPRVKGLKDDPLQLKSQTSTKQLKADPLQRQSEDEEMQMKADPLQRQSEDEEMQMKADPLQRQSEDEEMQMKADPLQRSRFKGSNFVAAPSTSHQAFQPVQRSSKEDLKGGDFVAAAVNKGQNSVGNPMPKGLQTKMESAFGTSFSDVRIHEGPQAEAVGALAYTQGSDIHFKPGQFDPNSTSGQELLGHELTHVVQQKSGRVPVPQGKGLPINADPSLEHEADVMGAKAAQGESVELAG